MAQKPYQLTCIFQGGAIVRDRATGVKLGEVQYRERPYGGRYVARWWNATAANGRKIAERSTRQEAAQALLEHARLPIAVQRVAEAAACLNHAEPYARKAAQETAARYVGEAIQLGADIALPLDGLAAYDLTAWCRENAPRMA